MRSMPLVLADAETQEIWSAWRIMDSSTRGALIVFGAITLVIFLVLIWAVFLRRSGRRRRSHQHSHHHSYKPVEAAQPPRDSGEPKEARKSRRGRRRHRSRNPTLAETGGLPPLRAEEPPEPLA